MTSKGIKLSKKLNVISNLILIVSEKSVPELLLETLPTHELKQDRYYELPKKRLYVLLNYVEGFRAFKDYHRINSRNIFEVSYDK